MHYIYLQIIIVNLVICFEKSLQQTSDSSQCGESKTTVIGTLKPAQICSGQLIFNDEFDTLDFEKWEHEETLAGGGNWEFQWYTNNRTNTYIQNGILYVNPTLTADQFGEEFLSTGTLDLNGGGPFDRCTNPAFYGCIRTGNYNNILNPVKSARIRTVNSFNFKYGRIEISAQTPTGDWLWPAIWMLPLYNAYGRWPASGEIDILETRGNLNLTLNNGDNIGANLFASTLHFGPNPSLDHWETASFPTRTTPGVNELYNYFHNYTVLWTPDSLLFYFDNQILGNVTPSNSFWEFGNFQNSGVSNPWENGSKMAPFDQEFHLIINLAVGGVNGYFPDNIINYKPWSNQSPKAATDFWNGRNSWLPTWDLNRNNGGSALKIDYIRVYAL